jgi:hypothetical protein
LPKTTAYTELVNFYNEVRASVQDLESKLKSHLQIMEILTTKQVTPHLTTKIQELSCFPQAEFDKLQMDACIKVDTGRYCIFYISNYSATTSYKRYIPVNYNGIEVKLPGHNIVVKSSDTDEQGLLYCEKPPVSSINSCLFQNWDPIKHLLKETHFYQYKTVILSLQTFCYLCKPMTTQFLWILYLK